MIIRLPQKCCPEDLRGLCLPQEFPVRGALNHPLHVHLLNRIFGGNTQDGTPPLPGLLQASVNICFAYERTHGIVDCDQSRFFRDFRQCVPYRLLALCTTGNNFGSDIRIDGIQNASGYIQVLLRGSYNDFTKILNRWKTFECMFKNRSATKIQIGLGDLLPRPSTLSVRWYNSTGSLFSHNRYLLDDEHCITKAEESVISFHSLLGGFFYEVSSDKRSRKRQKCRLRPVEVGDQRRGNLER